MYHLEHLKFSMTRDGAENLPMQRNTLRFPYKTNG